MANLDFEQLDRDAVQYIHNHLDPSFIREYDDDEIFLYVVDPYDDYTGMQGDDEEVCLGLDAIAAYVSGHLSQDMGVKIHEDDACDLVSVLYGYCTEEGLVDVISTDEDQE